MRERLSDVLDRYGANQALIVCGENLARSAVLDVVRDAAGREVAVFAGSRPHTPFEVVDAGAATARACGADALIALGGSSAVDCAKGIARLVVSGTERVAELRPAEFQHLAESPAPPASAPLPLLTVTTTLSFAEFFPFWGARDAHTRRKVPYHDNGTAVRTAFLDGEIAADAPDDVWVETGVKGLDDALAAYCRASGAEPFGDPLLVDAIAALAEWLPASMGRGRIAERQQVLTATWMTKASLPRLTPLATPGWLSIAVRHALGGVLGLPHGIGSCVALGPALQFHADATWRRQSALAAALGWPDADAAVPLRHGVADLLGRLGVPTRLGPLGVGAADLDDVVAHVMEESPRLGPPAEVRLACDRML